MDTNKGTDCKIWCCLCNINARRKDMLVMVAMLDCAAMGEQGKSCCHHRHTAHEKDVVEYDSWFVRVIKEQEKEATDFNGPPWEDSEV